MAWRVGEFFSRIFWAFTWLVVFLLLINKEHYSEKWYADFKVEFEMLTCSTSLKALYTCCHEPSLLSALLYIWAEMKQIPLIWVNNLDKLYFYSWELFGFGGFVSSAQVMGGSCWINATFAILFQMTGASPAVLWSVPLFQGFRFTWWPVSEWGLLTCGTLQFDWRIP